ncbi:MAG: DUF3179 domain-containing protein [Dehalococcoidia bacterium]|nr:DUF3179 domain-containing protein [Dehalococcoidia bacterium]
MITPSRLAVWLIGLGLVGAAACTVVVPGAAPTEAPDADRPATSATAAIVPDDRPSFSTAGWKTDFNKHKVPYSQIISGGVPRDGIPPVYKPKFEDVGEAGSWLAAEEPVVAFESKEDARAYPLRILLWHEIVNDSVGGIPVAITYCPLCNTAVVFDRRLEGQTLVFGVSGMLRNSDLIMWDHQTESWWQQATGEAIVGEHSGRLLGFLPSSIVSWEDFKATYPQGRVLSQDTGYGRPYGTNPYVGYDSSVRPFLFTGEVDNRLPALERVIGMTTEGQSVAYPFSLLAEVGAVNDTLAGRPLVVFYDRGTVSPLDQSNISKSRAAGAAAVYDPRVNGETLVFDWRDGRILDRKTSSTWSVLGKAVEGPLEGRSLKPVVHGTHFWFAWAAFNPDTRLYGR